MNIQFSLPVEPIPQSRPRFDSRTKRTYQPSRCKEYKGLVRMAAKSAMAGQAPTKKPCHCDLKIYRKYEATSRKFGDLDNHAKSILDAMNEIVFVDDSQIVKISVEKFKSQTPRIEVNIGDYEGD